MSDYLQVLSVIITSYGLLFVVAMFFANNSIVDIFWGLSFIGVAMCAYFIFSPAYLVETMVVVLVAIWGFRLFYHIFKRNVGQGEDFRYKKWRDEWGKWFIVRSFLQIFMLQGLMCFIISLPTIGIQIQNADTFNFVTVIGLGVWLFGFLFESIGDYQMKQFKRDPDNKGKLITTGLWKYTRHPNYFGEAVLWWGIFIIGLSVGISWWHIIGPITITILVRYVSGVPILERAMVNRPGFAEYKTTTPIFIPFIGKK